jgi:hypothetical protein
LLFPPSYHELLAHISKLASTTSTTSNIHISSIRTTSMNDGKLPIFSPFYFLLLISYFYYYRYDDRLGHDNNERYHHFHHCSRAEARDMSVSSHR